jgi:hypothetical protein
VPCEKLTKEEWDEIQKKDPESAILVFPVLAGQMKYLENQRKRELEAEKEAKSGEPAKKRVEVHYDSEEELSNIFNNASFAAGASRFNNHWRYQDQFALAMQTEKPIQKPKAINSAREKENKLVPKKYIINKNGEFVERFKYTGESHKHMLKRKPLIKIDASSENPYYVCNEDFRAPIMYVKRHGDGIHATIRKFPHTDAMCKFLVEEKLNKEAGKVKEAANMPPSITVVFDPDIMEYYGYNKMDKDELMDVEEMLRQIEENALSQVD